MIACTLIPFTVLKLHQSNHSQNLIHRIACTLIPFTVLKRVDKCQGRRKQAKYCMHPYTVYGIETMQRHCVPDQNNLRIACTLIPFTVLKRLF